MKYQIKFFTHISEPIDTKEEALNKMIPLVDDYGVENVELIEREDL